METSTNTSEFGSHNEKAKSGKTVLKAILIALERIATGIEQLVAQPTHPGQRPAALSMDEAAQYLGIQPKTLKYLVQRRKIRYVQIGNQRGRAFRRQDLDQYLEENTARTAQEILGKSRSPRRKT